MIREQLVGFDNHLQVWLRFAGAEVWKAAVPDRTESPKLAETTIPHSAGTPTGILLEFKE